MHYIIDGYNLLFFFQWADDDALKEVRGSLISDLEQKLSTLNISATIVFDSSYTKEVESRSHFHSLEIIFTSEGISADDQILDQVESTKHPKQLTVVTSDKRLAAQVRQCLAKTMSVQKFLSWLNTAYEKRKKGKEKGKEQAPSASRNSRTHQRQEETIPLKRGCTTTEDFEYYLYHFEKRFRKILRKEKKSQRSLPSSEESDFSRWQRIFEQIDKQNSQEEK